MYREVLDAVVQWPDELNTWLRPARRLGLSLLKRHDIDVVYTTSKPFTSLLIGRALQRQGVPWVADYRDPLSQAHRIRSKYGHVRWTQRRLEQMSVRNADALVTLSATHRLMLAEEYALPESHPLYFVTTGADDDLLPSPEAVDGDGDGDEVPYFVFVGEYHGDHSDRFFELFAAACADPNWKDRPFDVLVIGRREINEQNLAPTLERLNLQHRVRLLDHMPQRELYRYIKRIARRIAGTGSTDDVVELLRETRRLHRARGACPRHGRGPE